jgi:endonuclease/exonuclease/phosphatase family metal-dependent hydrolase
MSGMNRTTVEIAVWNLAGFQRMTEERAKRQVQALAILDADIVVLVELNPLSHLDRLVAGLRASGISCEGLVVPQPEGNPPLHIGILHKTGIAVTNMGLIEGSQGDYASGRRALVADLRAGKLDAHLIGVHLKSGRDAPEQRIRDSQCRRIGDYITAFRASRANDRRMILLLGDYNMIPGQDVSNFHHLGGDDLMDFVSCWDLQERFSHILEKGRANLLDGYAISRTGSTRYIRGTLRLFPMQWTMDIDREMFRRTVSDHLPFTARFRIT